MNKLTFLEENAAEILKRERELAGLKPGELARLSGLSQRTIYYIESGQLPMSAKSCMKLASVLKDHDGGELDV